MRLQSHVRFQVTGVPCPSPWARGAEKCRPSRPSPSEDKRCRHLPPPVRSQKKIPFPHISTQNPIPPGLRNPPENPLPAVTRSILPQTTGAIPLRRAILRQKHNIPIHRHIRQHPSPMTPLPNAQQPVHPRHLQIIPHPSSRRQPIPRHKPKLRTTPGRKPLPTPHKLNPANPHKSKAIHPVIANISP